MCSELLTLDCLDYKGVKRRSNSRSNKKLRTGRNWPYYERGSRHRYERSILQTLEESHWRPLRWWVFPRPTGRPVPRHVAVLGHPDDLTANGRDSTGPKKARLLIDRLQLSQKRLEFVCFSFVSAWGEGGSCRFVRRPNGPPVADLFCPEVWKGRDCLLLEDQLQPTFLPPGCPQSPASMTTLAIH